WIGWNNWENLDNYGYAVRSYVYYSVVESETHYFIGYYTFHARDDGPLDADKNENDLEGALLVIQKDGSPYGRMQPSEEEAHHDLFQYTNDTSISSGSDDIDDYLWLRDNRPLLYISANGAGIGSWGGHGVNAYHGGDAPGGDGIRYYYGGYPEEVSGPIGNWRS